MFNLFSFGTKAYEDLGGEAFKTKYNQSKNAVLIDVRTPGEFRSGSVRGARNIDIMSPSFNSQVENLDKSKEYFLICRSGSRSGQACSLMSKQGFTVYNLAGGIGEWPG